MPASRREPDLGLENLDTVIKLHLERVLPGVGWNFIHAGEVLGVDRRTVYRMMARYGLSRPSPARAGPPALHRKISQKSLAMSKSTFESFAEMRALVDQAFAAKASGNFAEARILLNEAIDIEHAVTGDAQILSDLFEEWGGDYERDQRSVTEDGECVSCGVMHTEGPCP